MPNQSPFKWNFGNLKKCQCAAGVSLLILALWFVLSIFWWDGGRCVSVWGVGWVGMGVLYVCCGVWIICEGELYPQFHVQQI